MSSSSARSGAEWDVCVLGGGVSGSIAAIAAARNGARTLLVEEQGFLGGTLTAMGVGPMMSFHNRAGEQLVRGLAQEVIDRLMARGASPGHVSDSTTYCSTVTPFDSEELKIELETMLAEAGGTVLYHSQLAGVDLDAEHIRSVTLCNKAGLLQVMADVFIDATGDADLSARAGVPFRSGREADGVSQPMTMNLKVANVDTAAIRTFARSHPEEFLWEHGEEEGLRRLESSSHLSLAGYRKRWQAAREAGEISVPREFVLFFETATPGVFIVNTSRVTGLDPTDPFQLSRAETIGRKQCAQIFHFLQTRCPGFENSIRMDTAPKIGVRESRHIEGRYLLTAEDLISQKPFPDTIALGGYPIDIHHPTGVDPAGGTGTIHLPADARYAIPLRSLLPLVPCNLIVSGRCISATHEASAAFRVTPIVMAIGQAAGTLAALASRDRLPPSMIDYAILRARLLEQGMILGVESQDLQG